MAIPIGLWAFCWNFVPQIGGFVGGVPFPVLAFGQGSGRGIVALIAFVISQSIENNAVQPIVIGRAIDLSPLVGLLAVLVGAALGGLVGAVLAAPTVGVVRIIRRELAGADFPGATQSLDHPARRSLRHRSRPASP